MKISLQNRSEMVLRQLLLPSRWVLMEFRTVLVLGTASSCWDCPREREREGEREPYLNAKQHYKSY